jgi:hypothetical protein
MPEFFYWYPTQSGELMMQILKKFGHEFQLEEFTQDMKAFMVIARFIDWGTCKQTLWNDVLAEKMTGYLLVKIRKEGSALFPGNWVWNGQEEEHSVIYKTEKQEEGNYRLIVYNTGLGLRCHHHVITEDSVIRGSPKWILKNIPKNRFPFLLHKLTRMSIGADKFQAKVEGVQRQEPYQLLQLVSSGEVDNGSDCKQDDFVKAQNMPNCCWKSLKTALRDHMKSKEEYKMLSLKIKEWCLRTYESKMKPQPQDDFKRLALDYARMSFQLRLKKHKPDEPQQLNTEGPIAEANANAQLV